MVKYFKMLGNVLLYLVIWFLCFKGVSLLFKLVSGTPFHSVLKFLNKQIGIQVILGFGIPILIYMLIFKLKKENFFKFCRFKMMTLKDSLLVLLVTFAGVIFTSHLINTAFFLKYLPEFNQYVVNAISKENLFVIFFTGSIFFTTAEEIIFRGLVFNEMRKCLPLVVVLLTHTLFYMPFQPTTSIAIFAYTNFTVYALVFVFADSLWASIVFQALGAIGLYGFKMLGFDQLIRPLGDGYLISVAIISLIVILIGTFSMKKAPLKEIFSLTTRQSEMTNQDTSV